jgi:hypothetical protein
MHGSSQCGTVLSGGFSLKLPAFIKIIHLDVGEETINFLISQTALLCRLIRSECICGCGHLRSTCGHVSTSLVEQREQLIVGYLNGQNKCLRAFPMY